MRRAESGVRVSLVFAGTRYTLGGAQVAVLRALCTASVPVNAVSVAVVTDRRSRTVYAALESLHAQGLVRQATIWPWVDHGPNSRCPVPVLNGWWPTDRGSGVLDAIRP